MKYKLSEIMDIIGGGTPKTSKQEYWNGDIPWLSVKDFNNDYRYVYVTEKTITQAGLENSSTKMLKRNDTIISARGTVGEMAMIPFPMAFNQSCYGLRAKEDIVIPEYLYYLVKHNVGALQKNTHGSVFDTITRETFSGIEVVLPSLEEQIKVVSVLSDIDDKIELNNEVNKNLEQQTQAIFKSWFVDFEPFGGSMPDDWTITTFGNVCNNLRERTQSNDYSVFSAVNTGELQLSSEYFTKQVFSKNIGNYLKVPQKAFAYNPARVNIGSIGLNTFDYVGCVSPVYVVFTVEDSYEAYFNYVIKTPSFKEEVKTRASGSVRQSLNYKDLALIEVVYPDKHIAKEFNDFFWFIHTTQRKISNESNILTELRDSLLPRLMSGELDVSKLDL